MELINTTPFLFAPISGRLNFPGHSLTYIVKATFDLKPGKQVIPSEEQLPPTSDEYYPDDEEQKGSVRYESDFAFLKPFADVMLVGSCFTPRGKPLLACPVKLGVGNAEKTLEVFGNRYWKNTIINPETTEPVAFTQMDLRYERSFGGQDYELNPIGRGYCEADVTIADNVLPVPNIQDPEDLVISPYQQKNPAGFGPLNRTWAFRQEKMGSYGGDYLKTRWPWFPDDFDWSHLNAAPQNQQIKGYLKGDEKLYFENLHPKISQYHTQLPGIRVRCFIRRFNPVKRKKEFEEIDLNLDTLWIDMEAEKLVLVWRGWSPVLDDEYEEILNVFLMSEPLDQAPASLYNCHELFKAEQKNLEEEWGLAPEEPEEIEQEKAKVAELKAVVPPIEPPDAEHKPTPIDQEELAAQVNAFLAKTGINIDELPPETQAQIKQQQTDLIAKQNDSALRAEMEQKELQAQMKDSLAQLNIDSDNLPTLTEKAKQEQQRFLQEIGLDDAGMHADPESNKFWTMIAAIMPKMGIDPENLEPFMQQAKPELEKIKKQMGIKPKPPEEKQQELDESEKQNIEKQSLQQRIDNKESFAGEDFSGKDLSGIDFKGADLSGALFIGANLSDSDLSEANLTGANFNNANLTNARMVDADLTSADLSNANMESIEAMDANFTSAILSSAVLNSADLSGANLSFAQLSAAQLTQASLKGACLNNADLGKADLSESVFEAAELNDTNFEQVQAQNSLWQKAKGKDAVFSGSDLSGSQFNEAKLSGTDFSHCTLTNTNFENAILAEASFEAVNAQNINFFKADLTKLRASEFSDFSNAKLAQCLAAESIWEHAKLDNADLRYTDMEKANFTKASLKNANLSAANMRFSRFLKADLSEAIMIQMNLMQGSLEKANLTHTDLSGSNLYGVEFLDAHLDQTKVEQANLRSTKLDEAG